MDKPEGFKVETEVSDERVADLLCSAFEGGSNYWYSIDTTHADNTCGLPSQAGASYWHEVPFVAGQCLVIRSSEEVAGSTSWLLNRSTIATGLDAMAAKHPRHWAAFMSENEDSETGDVFLQCCLFGEVVFG